MWGSLKSLITSTMPPRGTQERTVEALLNCLEPHIHEVKTLFYLENVRAPHSQKMAVLTYCSCPVTVGQLPVACWSFYKFSHNKILYPCLLVASYSRTQARSGLWCVPVLALWVDRTDCRLDSRSWCVALRVALASAPLLQPHLRADPGL